MNQAQKNYTSRRINEIENEKIRALAAECSIPAVRLTHQERYNLIKSGNAKLFPVGKFDSNCYGNIDGFFDFSEFTRESGMKADYEKRKEAIQAEARRTRDRIMLGEESEALEALQKFEKFKA